MDSVMLGKIRIRADAVRWYTFVHITCGGLTQGGPGCEHCRVPVPLSSQRRALPSELYHV